MPQQPCVAKFTSGSTIAGCNGPDVSCICANKDFLSNIACCLVDVCNQADQEAATTYAHQICAANGVTNLPASVVCTSSATSSTSTATGTNAASAATSGASTTTTSGASTSSSSPAATKNAGPHNNVAGVGAGILGGLAAVMGALV